MHAVVLRVTVNERDAAIDALRERVVPRAAQAPGFIAGYWMAMPGGQGLSVAVFESADAARTAAENAQLTSDFVTLESVEVCEVVASA
jgi:hypothetical protein